MAPLTVSIPEILVAYNQEFRSVVITSGGKVRTFRDIPKSQSVSALVKNEIRKLVEEHMKEATWRKP